MKLTADDIKQRFVEAADTLRRLRASRYTWPAGYVSAWPEVVREAWDSPPVDPEPAQARPPPPSSHDIDLMDEVFRWIEMLGDEREVRRLVSQHYHSEPHALFSVIERRTVAWDRARRVPWRRMRDRRGRSVDVLKRTHAAALAAIVRRLDEQRERERAAVLRSITI